MTTPTDQELEKVATKEAERFGEVLVGGRAKLAEIILSALKQVQPTKHLVDSIAVSPQGRIPATQQNVSTDVRETSEDSSGGVSKCCFDELIVKSGDEGTNHYVCGACGQPTDFATIRDLLKKVLNESYAGHNKECFHCAEINMAVDRFTSVPSPASTPSNPPKEGRASAESEKVAREFINDLEEHRYLGEQDERERIISSLTERIANCMGCVPNIDTQRLGYLLAMKLLQSDLTLDGEETDAVRFFTGYWAAMASNNPPAEEER